MSPRAPKKGPLAHFLDGMDAKTIALLVAGFAGLGGVKYQGDRKVEQVEAKADTVRWVANASRGRTRAAIESLTVRVVRDSIERRREVRALRRELARVSRPAVAHESQGSPRIEPAGGGDRDADEDDYGPQPAPAVAEKPKGRSVWGWFKKLGGG